MQAYHAINNKATNRFLPAKAKNREIAREKMALLIKKAKPTNREEPFQLLLLYNQSWAKELAPNYTLVNWVKDSEVSQTLRDIFNQITHHGGEDWEKILHDIWLKTKRQKKLPNIEKHVVDKGLVFLEELTKAGYKPTKISPLHEGGLLFQFLVNGYFATYDILNSDKNILVIEDPKGDVLSGQPESKEAAKLIVKTLYESGNIAASL